MLFTISKELERLPIYAMLRKLAEQNDVHVDGNERTGSFSSKGVEGQYECGENFMRGTLAGHGVKGEFSFETGKAAVTITAKPFWLPETLLKQKITQGLDKICEALVLP